MIKQQGKNHEKVSLLCRRCPVVGDSLCIIPKE
jgi:hypothetical protein